MFEHVILRRAEGGDSISAGQIAEALLYYQRVHVFFDSGTLYQLVRQIGADGVLTLLERPEISATYSEELLGTRTETFGVSQQRHSFVALTLSGHETVGTLKTPEDRLHYGLERQLLMPKHEARRLARLFLQRVPRRKFSGDHFISGGIPDAAKRDLRDMDYLARAVRQAVATVAHGYVVGDDLKIEVLDSEGGFFVLTDLNFDAINRKGGDGRDPLTVAHLLTKILEARADMALAAHYGGDFVTSAMASAMIRVRHEELLRRSQLNHEAQSQFSEVVLPDSPRLAEVIDAGERSFAEFLTLLDKASRFKNWLKTVNPDEGLIRAYQQDVTSEGWMQSLPGKTLRYVITKSIDAFLPGVAGTAAEFFDNFLLEKLLTGWRPNHFIDRRLAPFVNNGP